MTANKAWIHPTSRKSEKVDVTFHASMNLMPDKREPVGLDFKADVNDFGKLQDGDVWSSWFKVRMSLQEAESLAKQLQNFVDKYKEQAV